MIKTPYYTHFNKKGGKKFENMKFSVDSKKYLFLQDDNLIKCSVSSIIINQNKINFGLTTD